MLDAEYCTTPVYSNNATICVQWSTSTINERIKHLNLHKNQVHKLHHDRVVAVTEFPWKINMRHLSKRK